MKQKEYIQKAKTAILNRVRFHAPILYDDKVDTKALEACGLDPNLPVFKFEKALSKRLLKAFRLAQKEEKFNLAITDLARVRKDKLALENVVVYEPSSACLPFLEAVNKLNINYPSNSNYNIKFKDKFIKVGEVVLNPKFCDFSLCQTLVEDGIRTDFREFVLNGNNYFFTFKNVSGQQKTLAVQINIPLEKGYYYFKKQNGCVCIENLMTKQKLRLNFFCKNAKFSFSNVDGLENSVFCCINIRFSLTLAPGEVKNSFFNLGESKMKFQNVREIEDFARFANKKVCEIFNLKIKTKNPRFDLFFNQVLPKKIWINWANGECESILEEKYIALRRLFITGSEKISFSNFSQLGVSELGIFNGSYYKKIVVVQGEGKFLRVGKTYYYNINGLSMFSLTKKDPIALCLG